MEELGIGRPSTYAAVLAVLRDREYVSLDKKRLVPDDKGRIVTAFLESFFRRYVEYDFTADLEEKLDKVSNHEIDWKAVLRDFWRDFIVAVDETKSLRMTEVLDALNEELGPHIFPPRADGGDPRMCPSCGVGRLSLKLGKFGSFIGCSNYPECRYTRQLAAGGNGDAEGAGEAGGGPKVLGRDPATDLEVTLRDGRYGPYVQLGEGEKPKRQTLPKGTAPDVVSLEMALKLLSLPREVATHPETGKPILANIGRFGPYVQHEKTYANIGRDDDVLEIGANRAIDLIVAKEQGGGRRGSSDPGRPLGDDPESGKPVVVKAGRYGPYVTDGETNATLPKGTESDAVTLEEALTLLKARREAGGGKKGGSKVAAKKTAAKKPAAKKPAAKTKAQPAAGKTSPKNAASAKSGSKKSPAQKARAADEDDTSQGSDPVAPSAKSAAGR
ncbi:topoisomerase C-terminal repeat-containing protein, partial [Chelatococcus sp.]